MLKIIRNIFLTLFLSVFLIGSLATAFLIKKGYDSLPDVSELVEEYKPIIPTVIYDTNNEVIDKIYRENREIVSIDDVPRYVQYSFLAIEDRKFFSHYGFDFKRIIKGTVINLLTFRKMQGGSTITQQLAKNAFLSHERKIMRKVKEAIISIEIERKYTKDEILEKYINEIYFGEGAYGIQTAAKLFFNKSAKELTIAEAALLAGIPNRPSTYSPLKHLDNALKRQKLILRQMKNYGFITDEEYKEALEYKIVVKKSSFREFNAPDFTNIVTKKVFELFDEKEVYEGGLQIYTTMDLKMQKIAYDAFHNSEHIKKFKNLEGAMITIDSNSGHVKAVIGGKNFKSGNFNRAIMSKKQPGSAFKPFIYFAGLSFNYQMNIVFEDSPIKFGKWEPKNYEGAFLGNMTILEGMEKSQNIIAIKLLKKIIIKNAIKVARDAGITADIPYDLSIALGTMALSPYELAQAYIPFSNGGFKVKPIFITQIKDRYGKVIYEEVPEKEKIFDSRKISLLVHMMKQVVLNGSGRRAYAGIEQAGKTGTTNNFSNTWFAGFTPDFVNIVYIGYDNNKTMGWGMTGGAVAAPIWGDYVKKMIKEKIYTPSKFQFLENSLKDQELLYKTIDVKTGLLSDKTSTITRKALFERGYEPIEKSGKFRNGIEHFFISEKDTSSQNSPNKFEDVLKNIRLDETDSKEVQDGFLP